MEVKLPGYTYHDTQPPRGCHKRETLLTISDIDITTTDVTPGIIK